MLTQPRITIQEIDDNDRPDPYDFTPDDRRERARELRVELDEGKTQRTQIILSESERDDPTVIYFAINFRTGLHPHADESIATDVTIRQLDGLIQSLQLARDVAIAEGMIEPAE